MLIIRLKPVGKKKQISFRVTVGEKRSKLNGKVLEDLGFYNPHSDKFGLKTERIKYWISNGAQISDTVHNILVNGGVIDGPKIKVKMKKSKKAEETVESKPETPAAAPVETPVEIPAEAPVETPAETPAENPAA